MRTNGAAYVATALARLGVGRIFTLSGNQILSLYDALLDVGIPLTDTRHEAAAGHMAEAWARLRGEPGVCLVAAGPGHTNTLTAIANARLSETPVLWLSGGADLAHDGRGGFQEMDQAAIAAPVCKAAWRVESVDHLPALLARAWRTMLEGRPGPVHLTLPADLLARPCESAPLDLAACAPIPSPAQPDRVRRAVDLLAGARRPMVVASPSATRGAAGVALADLADATGLPWLTLESPRGLTDPALHGLGAAVREADVVLLLARQDFALAFAGPKAIAAAAHLIQVAPTADEIGRNRPAEVGLVGDAAGLLRQLAEAARGRPWRLAGWRDQLAAMQTRARAALEATVAASDESPVHPLRLATDVRAALPPAAAVSQDGGEFGQWARWAFGGHPGPILVNGTFGMIGPAIPFAIGAALARPGAPSVALLGDGTFGYHALEFDTAVRHGLPIIAVVGNDAGWAAERHRQVALYGPDRVVASDLLPTRYDEVVKALGGHGEFVQTRAELRPALRRALASGQPACVNVLIQSLPSPAEPV